MQLLNFQIPQTLWNQKLAQLSPPKISQRSQGINKHFPNRDEYETIDKSRKIIKRLEECSVDTRASNADSDSEMPTINSEFLFVNRRIFGDDSEDAFLRFMKD